MMVGTKQEWLAIGQAVDRQANALRFVAKGAYRVGDADMADALLGCVDALLKVREAVRVKVAASSPSSTLPAVSGVKPPAR